MKKLSILVACMFVFANMSGAAKLPLEKTLSAGREIKIPVTKGRIIQVVSKNMIDGKSSWQGISYKEGKVIGDPTMTTYNFSSQGQGMTVKFSRTIRKADTLGIKVLSGKVSFKMEEITPPPPDIKAEKFELKAMSGRGLLAKSDKELVIKITGDSKDEAAQGSFVLYNGEKPYQGEFKKIKYALNYGKTRSWKFPDKNKINSININNLSGKVRVRIEQPKFDIPKAKVKKTTEEMTYQLNSAIYGGAFDAAKQMLAMGVDINGQDMAGNTPLFMACKNGDPEFVKFLLGLGADPNIKNTRNSTAIIAAAANRYFFAELVPLLVEKGADLKVTAKDGTTVLWPLVTKLGRADEQEILNTVQLVLSKGAEVDPTIEDGRTPLMFAAMQGNTKMVKLLVENGANVNAKSEDGETALTLAEKEGHQKVVRLLKSSGAK
ncbi:MAG: ankyrin repeat domain-containing protein [Candidatus Margulisiibacteriota bacterium]